MKKEKQVRSYKRRTKSGKTVTVKAHTAKYEAADEKAKEVSKKPGAGKELEERRKKPVQLEIPFDKEEEKKVLDDVKDEEKKSTSKKPSEKKTTKKVRPVGSGTNGPTPKEKSEKKATKTSDSKTTSSEPAFTAAEFKEWYRGTGSAADKKVAKALRAQLGRAGYRKLEDEAIDNYSSRGHLSMFKRVSGGSEVSAKTGKSGAKEKDAEAKVSKSEFTQPPHSIKYKYKGETYYIKRKNVGGLIYKPTDVLNSKGEKLSKDEAATIKAAQQKSAERADKRGDRRSNGDKERMRLHGWADMGESTNKTEPKASTASGKSSTKSGNVKKETKGDRAVARMNRLVNEALSSTTSDPKALKKQLGALIDYNGGPINRGDKIGKRIDEIREQLGKRSSSSKEPAAIARHLSSYQKELDKMQKRKDAGFKYVGVGNNAIPPAGGGLEKVSSRIKYLKEQISLLEKGRKDFRNGKLDSAWKSLQGFNGITESSVYGRKYAISKNKQRAAEELESYGRFGGLTGSGTYGKYINGKKVSDAEYETHLRKSGYYKRPRPR